MISGYGNHSTNIALEKLRNAVNKAIDAQKLSEREYTHAIQQLKLWEAEYERAVHENNFPLFKQAVFQCERYQAITNRLQPLLHQHKDDVLKLQNQLNNWEARLNSLKSK